MLSLQKGPTNTHFKLYHLVSNFPFNHACFIETSKQLEVIFLACCSLKHKQH